MVGENEWKRERAHRLASAILAHDDGERLEELDGSRLRG